VVGIGKFGTVMGSWSVLRYIAGELLR